MCKSVERYRNLTTGCKIFLFFNWLKIDSKTYASAFHNSSLSNLLHNCTRNFHCHRPHTYRYSDRVCPGTRLARNMTEINFFMVLKTLRNYLILARKRAKSFSNYAKKSCEQTGKHCFRNKDVSQCFLRRANRETLTGKKFPKQCFPVWQGLTHSLNLPTYTTRNIITPCI